MNLSEQAREYADLVAKKREAKEGLENINAELTKLEYALLDRLADEGVASLKIDTDEGTVTLFTRSELWASCIKGHEDDLCNGLRSLGYADLITTSVHAGRLSSYIREIRDVGGDVPQEIAGAVQIREGFRIGIRRA